MKKISNRKAQILAGVGMFLTAGASMMIQSAKVDDTLQSIVLGVGIGLLLLSLILREPKRA